MGGILLSQWERPPDKDRERGREKGPDERLTVNTTEGRVAGRQWGMGSGTQTGKRNKQIKVKNDRKGQRKPGGAERVQAGRWAFLQSVALLPVLAYSTTLGRYELLLRSTGTNAVYLLMTLQALLA